MGIDIGSGLIYGLPYKDVPDELLDQIDEMLDDGELGYASPWYDSDKQQWVIGLEACIDGMTPSEAKDYLDGLWEDMSQVLKDCGKIALYVSAHMT